MINQKIEKVIKKQYNSENLPEFMYRLKSEDVRNHPCFNCLKETENAVNKGYWKSFPKPLYYWYEMCEAESKIIEKFLKENKPKKILEVGCGSGRILNILLKDKSVKEIVAVDKDIRMVEIVKPYYQDNNRVHIINQDIRHFLDKNEKFNLTLTMMNTLGNIDSFETMKLITKHSKDFIFTVYDKKYWEERKKIYENRGHRDFNIKNKDYFFNDCWVKGLKSKSYTENDLNNMCKKIGKKYKIKKISTLLFQIHIYE